VRERLPKIYSRELVDAIFEQPYCRIANLVDKGIAQRQAASYLQDLVDIGVLREERAGAATASRAPGRRAASAAVRVVPSDLCDLAGSLRSLLRNRGNLFGFAFGEFRIDSGLEDAARREFRHLRGCDLDLGASLRVEADTSSTSNLLERAKANQRHGATLFHCGDNGFQNSVQHAGGGCLGQLMFFSDDFNEFNAIHIR
jgi:hypothetical protein